MDEPLEEEEEEARCGTQCDQDLKGGARRSMIADASRQLSGEVARFELTWRRRKGTILLASLLWVDF